MIKELCRTKKYRRDTFYTAVWITEKYLARLGSEAYPDLLTLAITGLILAAKLNEPIQPSINLTLKKIPGDVEHGALK